MNFSWQVSSERSCLAKYSKIRMSIHWNLGFKSERLLVKDLGHELNIPYLRVRLVMLKKY